jgi:hypothetical protein
MLSPSASCTADGRRRQCCRAIGRDRQARRHLSFGRRLSAGEVPALGATQLKNIAEPIRTYSVEVGRPARTKPINPAPLKQRSLTFVPLGAEIVALIRAALGISLVRTERP